MGDITLSDKQQRKLEVVTRLASGKITTEEACMLLMCSERTVRRLRSGWEKAGALAVVHGNAGVEPGNATPKAVRLRIVELAGPEGPYHDLNVQHLQVTLAREDHIEIGRSTLDRLLKEVGARSPGRRARRRVYRRRERSAQEGFMLLIDGSLHRWLEKRGPKMCLIGAIDDATGRIVHLLFWPTECLAGYLMMLQDVTHRYGLPELLYHDKHTILRSPKEPTIEDELAGKEPMSQFQQVLSLLGVQGVAAHSPQAKGRIERLWGTLQDRLVKEMRLGGVGTLAQANAFLPGFTRRFNEEFSVQATDPEPAWVPIDPKMDTAYYFAQRETRTVKPDHTISWKGTTLQVVRLGTDPSLARKTVQVHTTADGSVFVYHGKQQLPYRRLQCPTQAKPETSPANPGSRPPAIQRPRQQKATDSPARRAWLYGAG